MEMNSYQRQASTHGRTSMFLVALCVGVLSLTVSASAVMAQNAAAKTKAKQIYLQGVAAYNAKDFKKAIELYLKAFAEYPAPIFYYNVAEAYKQLLDCPHTLQYYKRYLGMAKRLPAASRKLAVEKRAADLITLYSARCKEPEVAVVKKPPVKKPPVKKVVVKKDDPPEDDPPEDDPVIGQAFQPTKIHTTVTAGPSFVSLGDNETPVLFSLGAGLGYPKQFGKINADFGAAFTLTSVPWEGADLGMGTTTGTALMSSILANAGASYNINPKLSLRGEFGMGLLIFSGLADGNPFIPAGDSASGALSSFNVRIAAGANYALTDNIVVTALPIVFSYSPAPAGLTDDISALSRFEMMFGLGYRM